MSAALARRLCQVVALAAARWHTDYERRERERWATAGRFTALAPDGAALFDGLHRVLTSSDLAPPPTFLPAAPDGPRVTAWRVLHVPGAARLYAELRRRWAETMPDAEPWPWEDDTWWPNG